MAEATPKPTLSDTALRMLYRCGMQYFWRYIEGKRIPPAIQLIVGIATNKSVTLNLTEKKNTGKLKELDSVKDVARDTINGTWQQGVRLVGDELKTTQKMLKGEAVDKAVTLSTLHHVEVAPTIKPTNLERYFKIELVGYPMDLAGRIDIEEKNHARDTKTSAKSPPKDEAHESDQLTIYALGKYILEKKIPEKLFLDYLIATQTPKTVTLETRRTKEDFDQMYLLFEKAMEIIGKGAFMPNRGGWWCSDKWCGYWASTCPYGRRAAVSVSMATPTLPPTPTKKKTRGVPLG